MPQVQGWLGFSTEIEKLALNSVAFQSCLSSEICIKNESKSKACKNIFWKKDRI